MILSYCNSGDNLVRQILLYYRKDDVLKVLIDLNGELRRAFDLVDSMFPADVRVKISVNKLNSYILADSTQIQQVMLNLFNNAFYALRECGEDVSFLNDRLDPTSKVKAGLNLRGNKIIKLSFVDNGRGIPDKIKDRILEPFLQLSQWVREQEWGLLLCMESLLVQRSLENSFRRK